MTSCSAGHGDPRRRHSPRNPQPNPRYLSPCVNGLNAYLPRPPTASADGVRLLLDEFRLSASAELIDALILQLECLTGCDTG